MNEYPPYLLNEDRINPEYVALAFIERMKDENASVHTVEKTKEIFVFHSTGFVPRAENDIKKFVQEICGEFSTIQGQEEVLNYIRYETLITEESFIELQNEEELEGE